MGTKRGSNVVSLISSFHLLYSIGSNVIKNFIKKVVFMKKENNYFPIFTKKKRIS
ncbi:hypothetical protein CUZ96_1574 [Enterococcus lactis]|nr:hypothetical protein [Enterococcus lactis]MBL5011910.1 hypothetical protein [Enterococcus lactis]